MKCKYVSGVKNTDTYVNASKNDEILTYTNYLYLLIKYNHQFSYSLHSSNRRGCDENDCFFSYAMSSVSPSQNPSPLHSLDTILRCHPHWSEMERIAFDPYPQAQELAAWEHDFPFPAETKFAEDHGDSTTTIKTHQSANSVSLREVLMTGLMLTIGFLSGIVMEELLRNRKQI